MDIKPGTPEYDEAYNKEMQRLEAEANPSEKKDPPVGAEIPPKEAPKPEEELSRVRSELETLNKRLADTQRWSHENAAEVKRLKKEAEDRKHAETKPAILDANAGLEDAIKYVAGTPKQDKPSEEQWLSTILRAVPDVETLLSDDEFKAKAAAKRAELGSAWDDPINAIRELSSIKAEHLSHKASQAAVDAARKDFDKKSQKRSAMQVPGGSGGKDAAPDQDDAVKRYQTMSSGDFDKEVKRVMGY